MRTRLILSLTLALALFHLRAQTPPDTTFGQGALHFQYNALSVEGVYTRMKAVAMTDSVIPTEYTGRSDSKLEMPLLCLPGLCFFTARSSQKDLKEQG